MYNILAYYYVFREAAVAVAFRLLKNRWGIGFQKTKARLKTNHVVVFPSMHKYLLDKLRMCNDIRLYAVFPHAFVLRLYRASHMAAGKW